MTTAKRDLSNPQVQGPPLAKLLTVRQVAALFSVSETTVYRLKRHGEISCIKVRGSLRFRPEDLIEYERRQAVTAAGYAESQPVEPRLNLAFPVKRRRAGSY